MKPEIPGNSPAQNSGDDQLNAVLNYPYQITGSGITKIHLCLFKPDFTPAKGAEVTVNQKPAGTADENGVVIFEYTPGSGGSHQLEAVLRKEKATLRFSTAFRCNGRTESFRSDQLYVYTDRGLYNPGDTILCRLIAWELLEDYRAIPGAEISLLLQSPAGKVHSGEKLVTDEYGIAAAKLPLPQNMPEGDYELVVLYNQAREVARLQVKRFVPPVIEIQHNLKHYLTPAQESLKAHIELSYFSGGKPTSSTLILTVLDDAGSEIFRSSFKESSSALFDVTIEGAALASIKKRLRPEMPCKVVLEATDSYGQSCTLTRDMHYTNRPFSCVLEFDKDDYPAGETVKLLAKVVDLDGKPAGNLPLLCQVNEFPAKFETTTDDNGIALFSFTMGGCHGTAVITTPLMAQALASGDIRFRIPKPMTSKVSEPPQKEGIATYFTVHFSPDYVPVEKVVHVDFTDISGGLVSATTIPITRLQEDSYMASGTVKAHTWGTMLANLYCCAAERRVIDSREELSIANVGFITEGQHVTLCPDRELSITVKDFKPVAAPGSEARFEIEVAAAPGREAALGASLVDKAVISLLDPFETSPHDRFYQPQLKVISTGGAAVLTWPVVDRNWGMPCRDIAYSDWGFKAPGVRQMADQDPGLPKGGFFSTGSGPMEETLCMAEAPPPPSPLPGSPPSDLELCAALEGDFPGAPMESQGRSAGKGNKPSAKPKVITIRTKFPETALWEPFLKTDKGQCTINVKFPDSITVQRLSLVATDREGGLGVLHKDIVVSQDIFIHPDMPAVMTIGDEVRIAALVKNTTETPCRATVSIDSGELQIQGDRSADVELSGRQEQALSWTVRAQRCGPCEFTVQAHNESFEDSEKRVLFVRPAGFPLIRTVEGSLTAGTPFRAQFSFDRSATWRTAFLNVSFPGIIPAIQGWQAIAELPVEKAGVAGVAGRSLCDCAFLSWAEDRTGCESQIKAVRARLRRTQAELLTIQHEDGSWGWFSLRIAPGGSGFYGGNTCVTALVLKALLEMNRKYLSIHWETLMRALEAGLGFLWSTAGKEGLWSYGDAFFWEAHAPEACWSLSAEIFDIMTGIVAALPNRPPDARLATLKEKIHEKLRSKPDDPAFVAHAVKGLLHYGSVTLDRKLDSEMNSYLDFLLTLKRRGYWEPHWYHAYGGMVELNALILELLFRSEKVRYESHIREIVTWLISTRKAWGAWHNESGTAAAMRALLLAGAGAHEEIDARVIIKANGRTVTELSVDPGDPFLSLARLRSCELTSFLNPGENEVEVSYDGNLAAPVLLELKEWPAEVAQTEPAVPGSLSIRRDAPPIVHMGEPVTVTLELTAPHQVPVVQIIDSIPSNMSIDENYLRQLLESGKISSFHLEEGSLTLSLENVQGCAALTYRLFAARAGSAGHSGTTVMIPVEGAPSASAMGQPITVEE